MKKEECEKGCAAYLQFAKSENNNKSVCVCVT